MQIKRTLQNPTSSLGRSRAAGRHRTAEPPIVSFDVARAILIHSIWLGSRITVNVGSTISGTFKVSVDVVNLHICTTTYTRQGARRNQLKFWSHAMQPNHRITCANLCMHRNALAVSLNTTRRESEDFDEKVVRSSYVLVHEQRRESMDRRHLSPYRQVSRSFDVVAFFDVGASYFRSE
jgi:hypothetical protein